MAIPYYTRREIAAFFLTSNNRPVKRPPSSSHPVSQHKAGAAGAADAVAEIVGGGPRVGADPHLIEQVTAPGTHHRAQQARILVADHGTQPFHRPRIHRERLVAVEACGKLHAPQFGCRKLHMLFELGDKGIGCAPDTN